MTISHGAIKCAKVLTLRLRTAFFPAPLVARVILEPVVTCFYSTFYSRLIPFLLPLKLFLRFIGMYCATTSDVGALYVRRDIVVGPADYVTERGGKGLVTVVATRCYFCYFLVFKATTT